MAQIEKSGIFTLDLDNIFKYITSNENNIPIVERELTNGYENGIDGDGLLPSTKVVRELSTNYSEQAMNIKYDFIKTLLQYLFTSQTEPTVGQAVTIETMLKYNFLKQEDK